MPLRSWLFLCCSVGLLACGQFVPVPPPDGGAPDAGPACVLDGGVDGGVDVFSGAWSFAGSVTRATGPSWPASFPLTIALAANCRDYSMQNGNCAFVFKPVAGTSRPTLSAGVATSCKPDSTAVFAFNGAAQPLNGSIQVVLTNATMAYVVADGGVPTLTLNGVGTLTANGTTEGMSYTYTATQ